MLFSYYLLVGLASQYSSQLSIHSFSVKSISCSCVVNFLASSFIQSLYASRDLSFGRDKVGFSFDFSSIELNHSVATTQRMVTLELGLLS